MRQLNSAEAVAHAKELAKLIEQRKANEKREKELKAYFIEKNGGAAGFIRAGDLMICIVEGETSSLDRKSLEATFGADKIAPFVKVTPYLKTEVKAA